MAALAVSQAKKQHVPFFFTVLTAVAIPGIVRLITFARLRILTIREWNNAEFQSRAHDSIIKI